jgi:hypothetical protein
MVGDFVPPLSLLEKPMAYTLDMLMEQARFRSDMVNSQFISDAELIGYINNSYGELYDLLVTAYGNDYFVDGYEFTTSGKAEHDIPVSFQKCVSVDFNFAGTTYTMMRYSFSERNRFKSDTESVIGGIPRFRYRIVNSTLMMYPTPEAGYKCTLHYIPQCPKLTNTSDKIHNNIVDSWAEYIIVDVAAKMLIKEESDPTALLQHKQSLSSRIQATAQTRDQDMVEPEHDETSSLFNLIHQVRHRCDVDAVDIVSDVEIEHFINQSYGELYDIMINALGNDYFVDAYESVTTGLDTIDLPTNFYKLVSLDMTVGGISYPLIRFNLSERNQFKNSTEAIVNGIPKFRYRVVNKNIVIYPKPEPNFKLTLWYIPQLTRLSKFSDQIDSRIIQSYDDYIITDCCAKIAIKQGKPADPHIARKQEIIGRINTMSKGRDYEANEPDLDSGSTTLYNILRQVKHRADLSGTDLFTDIELIHYINGSLTELYDLLVQSVGSDYFIDGYECTTAGKNSLDLPEDFYKLISVDMEVAGTKYPLLRFSFSERNKYLNSTEAIENGIPRFKYRVVNDSLLLYPTPESGYKMTLWYIPEIPKLTKYSDQIDHSFVEGWIEYVVVDCCIKALAKQAKPADAFMAKKQELVGRINAMSRTRDYEENEPELDSGDTTLFNLIRQIKHRGDLNVTDVISDIELIHYINGSRKELYDLMIQSFGNDYFVDGYEFSTAGKDTIDLPDDFYKLVAVDVKVNSITYPLLRFNFAERNKYLNSDEIIVNGIPKFRYRLVNKSLILHPVPETGYKMAIWYIPQLGNMVKYHDKEDNNVIDSWMEYVVVDCVIKAMAKQGKPADAFIAKKQELIARISAAAKVRDFEENEPQFDSGTTLFNLRQQVRYRGNVTGADQASDTELNSYINNSLSELYDLMIKAYGNDYFLADGYEFTSVGQQEKYQLPSDFYKLALAEMVAGGRAYTMERFPFGEKNIYKNAQLVNRIGVPYYRYRLIDNFIQLAPVPDTSYTIKIYYIPQMTKLVKDSDVVKNTMIESWLEYVIIDAAIKINVRQGKEVAALSAQKQDMLKRLIDMADARDFGNPETITDTSRRHRLEWVW